MTNEAVEMQGRTDNATKDDIDNLMDAGVLQAGALPGFDVEEEAGQQELLAQLTNEPFVVKKRKSRGKDKATEVRPRTAMEEASDKAAEVLKSCTKAKELCLSLETIQYGGNLKQDLSRFSDIMERLYKKLQELINRKEHGCLPSVLAVGDSRT